MKPKEYVYFIEEERKDVFGYKNTKFNLFKTLDSALAYKKQLVEDIVKLIKEKGSPEEKIVIYDGFEYFTSVYSLEPSMPALNVNIKKKELKD